MAQTSEQARDSYVQGIEAKAGRPIDELVAAVVGWGPGKHTELLKRAKEAFGLGHGHANLLVHLARDRTEAAAGAPPEPADLAPCPKCGVFRLPGGDCECPGTGISRG